MNTNNFFRFFLLAAFSLATAFTFTSCGDDDPGPPPTENGNGNGGNGNGNGNGSTNPGIGEPTATTDPGVVIGETRWATRNVDAPGTFAEYPHSFGMFYQWNRNIGWSSTDPMVNSNGGTTWDDTTPAGTAWYAENCPCPPGWRVPSLAQMEELLDTAGESTWTNNHNNTGVAGKTFTVGNNVLFLPAVGWRSIYGGSLGGQGGSGRYWGSTQGDSEYAQSLWFSGNDLNYVFVAGYWRLEGRNVRCVAK